MANAPILIANTRKGLERDVEAFLLPQDAYPDLEDVFMFRGRIPRRFGLKYIGQIVQTVTQNFGARGAPPQTIAGPLTLPAGSFQIVPNTISITDTVTTFQDDGAGNLVVTAGSGTGATVNYFTGAFGAPGIIFTGAAPAGPPNIIATFDVISGLPCMGLRTRIVDIINQEQMIAFDTKKANIFISNATPIPPAPTGRFEDITFYKSSLVPFSWSGSDSQFFWATNYQNAFFATNSKPGTHAYVITGISTAASAVITFTGGDVFLNGDIIAITNVIQPSTDTNFINGKSGTVTAHGAGTVTVNINTAAGFTYTSGGIVSKLTDDATVPPGSLGDGIRWYDGTGWVNFQPPVSASATGTNVQILQGALIILPYKNRLVCLNTTEGVVGSIGTQFFQRARYSEVGTVYYNTFVPSAWTGSSQADAWRSDIVGRGGFIDAPTQQEIIGAFFIKDTLVVAFEKSTWQLRYTGDPTIPFIWEQINAELGAESTFSVVPFDRGVLSIGNQGILTCDSVNVQRIDQIIPDEVFSIHNENAGVNRVCGIRDYTKQLVYWSFPNDFNTNPTAINIYPTRVLVYNYLDGSFSYFNDSITAFGLFQTFSDIRWEDLDESPQDEWQNYDGTWNASSDEFQGNPQVVGGNQQGYIFFFNGTFQTENDPSLTITGISQASPAQVTSPNHNLQVDQFIQISGVNGMTQINGYGPLVAPDPNAPSSGSPNGIYKISSIVDANNFTIKYIETTPPPLASGYRTTKNVNSTGFTAYTNGGHIAVLNNFSISTTQFNPFADAGLQTRLSYADFFLEGATNQPKAEFSVNLFLNQNQDSSSQSVICSPSTTTGQQKMWFRTIPNVMGQYVQLQLTLSDLEMADPNKSIFDFTLHAMALYFDPASRFMFGDQL